MSTDTRLPFFSFLGGKGGVGKTTCAAIFALESARDRRTLLVTTDPASSLSAALKVEVGSDPAPVRGAKNLYAANLDASRAFERWLAPRRELLATIALRGTYLDDDDVARLLKLSLPGIDEVIGLLEITRMVRLRGEAERAKFDTVIVDTAPTGHTLRLLAAPALLGRVAGVLDSLQAHHRAVVAALRGGYSGDAADSLIVELEREGDALASMLRDPAASEVSWVTLPEPMALEETADAIASLSAAGIHVRRLIVNRLTPGELVPPKPRRGEGEPVPPKRRRGEGEPVPPKPRSGEGECAWCEARRRFEARALVPVAKRFADLELLALPDLPREPRGVVMLRAAAAALEPWSPPASAPPIAHRVRAFDQDLKKTRPADLLEGQVRWLLFGGKGGVGKSTCAAATALDLAGADPAKRVLLLSMDPAHSLGDVFGAPLGDRVRTVPGAPPNLQVREIDAAAEMTRFRRKYIDAVDEAFARIARTAGGDQAAFRELIDLAPPGIDEVIAIADVAEALTTTERRYDVIVTDTAPTGHALRLLETPAVLRQWTQALMTILLKYREIVGAGTLASLLVQLSKRLRGLQGVLADPAQTRFVVVTRAAALPAVESANLIASLRSLGIAVQAVIVNAVGAGSCGRCREIARAEQGEIARLRRAIGDARGYAIIETPAELPPPHGAAALAAWGRAWRQIT
jgi:arsenite/tail-anchored protein-transporting ATPase